MSGAEKGDPQQQTGFEWHAASSVTGFAPSLAKLLFDGEGVFFAECDVPDLDD
jgi:hypothetical protein